MTSASMTFAVGGVPRSAVRARGVAAARAAGAAQRPVGSSLRTAQAGTDRGQVLSGLAGKAAVAGTIAAVVGATSRRRKDAKGPGCKARVQRAVRVGMAAAHKSGQKPKVVVLGSGWGAVSFLQGLSEEAAQMYDITLVSPRNHFLYTPLLPTCTMGSIEERSIVTPIREITAGKASFLEAKCEHVDTAAKRIRCGRAGLQPERANMAYDRFPAEEVDGKLTFELDYDMLVYTVGAQPNDFNCPGVREHAFLFKEVEDARNIRNKITDVFEKAALPMATKEEKDALLSFLIVGGGPTGVEVAADLCDFIRDDVGKLYPELVDHVKVRLINTGDHLLSTYDRNISKDALETFAQNGVETLKGYRVAEITPSVVKTLRKEDGETVELPYGCIVWCTGIKMNELSRQVKESILEMNSGRQELDLGTLQENRQGIVTDEWLQVKGSWGSIFALGDASTVQGRRVTKMAEELFAEGDVDGGGTLCVDEMKTLFRNRSRDYPQLEEYAQYFNTASNDDEPEGVRAAVMDVFSHAASARKAAGNLIAAGVATKTAKQGEAAIEEQLKTVDLDGNLELDQEEFKELLSGIDKNLRSFPATAQVAAQQGKYLAKLFATGLPAGGHESYLEARGKVGPFTYFHKGALAYLGGGSAAFDVPIIGAITGPIAGLAWKAYETISQVTPKNRALVGWDWVRTEVFGRDTSRF